MSPRPMLAVFAFLIALAGCLRTAGAQTSRPAATKPNVLFILMDDLGWHDVGFNGSRYYRTPNIDRLASQGMVFANAYAAAPNCAPSRACLMTGQYTPRHGIYTVGTSERGRAVDRKLIPTPNTTVLADGHPSMAAVMKSAGYATGFFGKWHIGEGPKTGPLGRGYDVNFGGDAHGGPPSYFSPYSLPTLPDGPKGESLTERLTSEAIGFMTANKDRPFYLQLSHYAVHTPLQARPEIVQKYKGRPAVDGQDNPVYAAMIESMDDSVGRLMQSLDGLGIADRTVVVFFSDNGGFGGATSNAPLRGYKGMPYEGGVREPMIVRWPGVATASSVCREPVIGVDFLPTLADIAGAKVTTDQPIDGKSLLPLLRGEPRLDRDAIFWHCPVYLEAGGKRMQSLVNGIWRCTPFGSVRMRDWKLIETFETGRAELFNLANDPYERHDLAADRPDVVHQLRDRLAAWRQQTNAPVPAQPNAKYDPNAKPNVVATQPSAD